MEHIRLDASTRFQNSKGCIAHEYRFDGEEDINSALIELNGRYPDKGFAVNLICKEIVYVVEGAGKVFTADAEKRLEPGDMLKIQPRERYYFEGVTKLLISSSPAWYPEQYQTEQ